MITIIMSFLWTFPPPIKPITILFKNRYTYGKNKQKKAKVRLTTIQDRGYLYGGLGHLIREGRSKASDVLISICFFSSDIKQ